MAFRKLWRSQTIMCKSTRIIAFFVLLVLFSWSATLRSRITICDAGGISQENAIRSKDPNTASRFHQISDSDIYIYSASYDNRYQTKFIRIFGMQDRRQPDALRCRFQLDNGLRIDLPAETSYPIYKQWPSDKLLYHAYYYGCEVPDVFDFSRNFTFSLFIDGENLSTNIPLNMPSQINHGAPYASLDKPKSRDIIVCVKAIWGHVNATRLVEWFEFHRLLGVNKIVMYDTTTLGPAVRILRHYQDMGLLELVYFDYALRMNTIMRKDPFLDQLITDEMIMEQTYLVSMNDCYYRHYSMSAYVMIIDFDEVIVPNNVQPLNEMIRDAERQQMNASAFLFQTAWHLEEFGAMRPEVPGYMHMQKFTKRSPVMQSQPKAIISSGGAIAVNWHGTVTMPTGYGFQGNQYLPWQRFGYVHHYRTKCKYDSPKCAVIAQMVELDEVIPKYGNELLAKVERTLRDLRIL